MKVNKTDQCKIVKYPGCVVTGLYLITGERMFVKTIAMKVAQAHYLVIVVVRHMEHIGDTS